MEVTEMDSYIKKQAEQMIKEALVIFRLNSSQLNEEQINLVGGKNDN